MNYFNYFTEIETRFQQRRGSILMLSTLDWALIETWREAGIPLEAVLRGIDSAFDNYDAQRARLGNRRPRKVNGLAWCAQAVLEAVEQARKPPSALPNPPAPNLANPASKPPASRAISESNASPAHQSRYIPSCAGSNRRRRNRRAPSTN